MREPLYFHAGEKVGLSVGTASKLFLRLKDFFLRLQDISFGARACLLCAREEVGLSVGTASKLSLLIFFAPPRFFVEPPRYFLWCESLSALCKGGSRT